MFKITVKHDFDKLAKQFRGMAAGKVRFAASKAVTQTAHKVREATIVEMRQRLDRPTNYTLRQAMQVDPATKRKLIAVVGLGVKFHAPAKGTPYVQALAHQFEGGDRSWKRMEARLMHERLLPRGMAVVPPKAGSAYTRMDSHGNVQRGLIVQLLAYFNALGGSGFKSNMLDKTRARMAKRGVSEQGFARIGGVVYFVSHGPKNRMGSRSWQHGRNNAQLAAGIWAKTGTHGSKVVPVLLFVRKPRYRQRIAFKRIAEREIKAHFGVLFGQCLEAEWRAAR